MARAASSRMLLRWLVGSSILIALVGCAGHHAEDDGDVDSTSAALTATDPVSVAVTQSCTTASVKGLGTQLVEEIQCLRPNTMKKLDGVAGFKLGAAVFPYLQTPAADALIAAQKARNVTMSINSGLRTLPQQYLLYRWYQTGRCGISLAASPGKSNHESAIAIDIEDNAGWRTALQGKSYRWLGASDPVHYDFIGGGAVDLRGLSVKAFQRLWNRNHPEDLIPEDSAYGQATEKRLAQAPSGGFAVGAICNAPGSPAPPPPAGGEMPAAPAAAPTPASTPDANEPSDSEESSPSSSSSDNDDESDPAGRSRSSNAAATAGGCSMSGGETDVNVTGMFGMLALAVTLVRARRRGSSASALIE